MSSGLSTNRDERESTGQAGPPAEPPPATPAPPTPPVDLSAVSREAPPPVTPPAPPGGGVVAWLQRMPLGGRWALGLGLALLSGFAAVAAPSGIAGVLTLALALDAVDLQRCEIRIEHAKWGKWRDIGFGKQTQKYLSRYMSIGRPEPMREGDRHFFLSVDGYPLTVNAVEQMCQRISRRVGFRVHPHRFRHTFAVGMLRGGTDIRTLQKLMGHASVQILMCTTKRPA